MQAVYSLLASLAHARVRHLRVILRVMQVTHTHHHRTLSWLPHANLVLRPVSVATSDYLFKYTYANQHIIARTVWQNTLSFVRSSATNAQKMSDVQLLFQALFSQAGPVLSISLCSPWSKMVHKKPQVYLCLCQISAAYRLNEHWTSSTTTT